MRIKPLAGVVLCASIVCAPVRAAGPGENAARINARLEKLVDDGFQGQVVLELNHRVVLDETYGQADATSGTPAAPDTLYYIGSLAKMFTSAVVLQLEQEGKLALDDPIGKHLDDLPRDKAAITIRQLLSHTGGIVANHPDPLARLDREDFLTWFKTAPLQHKPGTKWSYSNVGYSVLAAIIEHAGGEPFTDAVRRRIFEPAGMRDTFFLSDTSLNRSRVARGAGARLDQHELSGDPLEFGPTWLRLGPGGILSTARDLLKWNHALRRHQVLSQAQYTTATTPCTIAPEWGLGWRLSPTPRGTPLHFHDGGFPGFNAAFGRYPEESACIILLCNRDDAAAKVVDWIARELFAD